MNSAAGSTTCMTIHCGCNASLIYEGHGGMFDGSSKTTGERKGGHQSRHLRNLMSRVVGDGSLTAANTFCFGWTDLAQELVRTDRVTPAIAKKIPYILIVGDVGFIDNTFCGNVGSQIFIETFQVMGRQCGYLALVVVLASEADFCFILEWPASENWRDVSCDKLSLMRSEGQRLIINIVADGAIDRDGTAVKNMYDTRIAILGHVQRGGASISF
ncbi:unnamed protein product [Caenorhabditis nigoni]